MWIFLEPELPTSRDLFRFAPGDVVSFRTRTVRTGTSSVIVEVRVEAERHDGGDIVLVTEANLTMVSVDAGGKSIPFAQSPDPDHQG